MDYLEKILDQRIKQKLQGLEDRDKQKTQDIESLKAQFLQLNQNIQQKTRGIITLGGGCFWCVEAVMQRIKGVLRITSGYSGGFVEFPKYEDVKQDITGHAEVVQIEYDSTLISFGDLLYIFMCSHDPTPNYSQKVNGKKTYRSIIFYRDNEEQQTCEDVLQQIKDQKIYKDQEVLTEIQPFKAFYIAENKHQNYYNNNPEESYCQRIIDPKVQKFVKQFSKFQQEA